MLGLSFETDWGEENIVVKSVQVGSHAARETDIRVGDALIEVNDVSVNGGMFEDALRMIKSCLSSDGCTIKLRTVEEKLRLTRESAFRQIQKKELEKRKLPSTPTSKNAATSHTEEEKTGVYKDSLAIRVELRQVESSVVILASELDLEKMEEYRIENHTVGYKLYYKQKGISGTSWSCIQPGQASSFIWEDPFKPHKLLMHVGENVLCPSDHRNEVRFHDSGEIGIKGRGDDSLGVYLSYLSGMKADSAIILNMDEIGFTEELPLQKPEKRLIATIRSEGPTKVLIIAPTIGKSGLLRELTYGTEFIFEQLNCLREFHTNVESIHAALFDALSMKPLESNVSGAIGKIYSDFVNQLQETQKALRIKYLKLPHEDDFFLEKDYVKNDIIAHDDFLRLFDAGIDRHHQLLVEVIEAKEITPFVVGKVEDIYCQIYVRDRENLNIVEYVSPFIF